MRRKNIHHFFLLNGNILHAETKKPQKLILNVRDVLDLTQHCTVPATTNGDSKSVMQRITL